MARLKNEQHEKFCRNYVLFDNGTKAAIDAGYAEKSARHQASRLLTNDNIKARVAELRKGMHQKADKDFNITVERVLEEYAKLAFFNPKELFDDEGKPIPIHMLKDDVAAVIAGLDIQDVYEWDDEEKCKVFVGNCKKYKLTDKRSTLDSLSKTLGLFQQNVNIKGEVATTVHYDFGDDEE